MPWTTPDFQEISLNMEVTAYVYTDETPRRDDKERDEEPAKSASQE